MATENPSSDDLIRQAKESVSRSASDISVPAASPEDIAIVTGAIPSRPPRETGGPRRRSAGSPSSTRTPSIPREARQTRVVREPVAAPQTAHEGQSGSGKLLRIAGTFILLAVAGLWILLLIGLIDDQSGIGQALGGGAVITIIPIVLGLVLRRAGIRRGSRSSSS